MNGKTKFLSFFKRKRFLTDVLIIAVGIIAINYWQTKDLIPSGQKLDLAIEAPNLKFENRKIDLDDGKVKVIYFFAPWCPACKIMAGNVNLLNKYLPSTKADVLSIALNYESIESVRKYVEDRDLQTEVLLGDNDLNDKLRVSAFPTFYFIDQKGNISSKSVGYTTTAGLFLRSWYALYL
jgi:thiol-disulfide isomerase/thioredoxin